MLLAYLLACLKEFFQLRLHIHHLAPFCSQNTTFDIPVYITFRKFYFLATIIFMPNLMTKELEGLHELQIWYTIGSIRIGIMISIYCPAGKPCNGMKFFFCQPQIQKKPFICKVTISVSKTSIKRFKYTNYRIHYQARIKWLLG